MSKRDERVAPMSDYFRVLHYLAELRCPACGGVGGAAKPCKFCKETGFREGNVHLLVSARQTRGVR